MLSVYLYLVYRIDLPTGQCFRPPGFVWQIPPPGPWNFNNPLAVTVDQNGNVYVADTYHKRIQKFTSDWEFLAKWETLGRPYGIAVYGSKDIYVADTNNHYF